MPKHLTNRRSNRRRRRRTNNTRQPFGTVDIIRASRVSDRQIHKMVQNAYINLPYVPSSGIGGNVPDICFAVAQVGLLYSQSNAAWNTVNWNNYAQYATVFQEYRIMAFEIELFTSVNTVTMGVLGTGTQFPMAYGVVDYEDAVKLPSAVSALQYSSCVITQPGSVQGSKKICCTAPAAFLALDNDATFIGTVTATGIARQQWLACGTNSSSAAAAVIPHGYVKYYFDNLGSTTATTTCILTFIVRAMFEYRGID
jgi:hypothetical protein